MASEEVTATVVETVVRKKKVTDRVLKCNLNFS